MTLGHSYQILETSKMIDIGGPSIFVEHQSRILGLWYDRRTVTVLAGIRKYTWYSFNGLISIYDIRIVND